jgi:hypothetical protein
MKIERTEVDYLLWRKKVDWSLVDAGVTPIPGWVCNFWEIPQKYATVFSKKDSRALVKIAFEGKDYQGWVTCSRMYRDRKSPLYRLSCEKELIVQLRQAYMMSYLRGLEARLRKLKEDVLCEEVPFWEFLDIEFDRNNQFIFNAHYVQKAIFPFVFSILTKTKI